MGVRWKRTLVFPLGPAATADPRKWFAAQTSLAYQRIRRVRDGYDEEEEMRKTCYFLLLYFIFSNFQDENNKI